VTRHTSSHINPPHASMRDDLRGARAELLAQFEQHQPQPLAEVLRNYPALLAELTDFYAGLLATSQTDTSGIAPDTSQIATRAVAKAFARVYPTIKHSAVSLKAARQHRHITLKACASRLGIGVDVLSYLEAGLIRAASVPDRLISRWSAALAISADEVQAMLASQVQRVPALQRNPWGGTVQRPAQTTITDFADAIRTSPNMSDDEKAIWLAE